MKDKVLWIGTLIFIEIKNETLLRKSDIYREKTSAKQERGHMTRQWSTNLSAVMAAARSLHAAHGEEVDEHRRQIGVSEDRPG